MFQYSEEIQKVVGSALDEMAQLHSSGKLINASAANNAFLARWLAKTIKQQAFDKCVTKNLTTWQKASRSKGNQSDLVTTFRRISQFYQTFFSDEKHHLVTDAQIEAFLELVEEKGWSVSTSEPLVNAGKIQFFTDGKNSLALCANQCDDCFDGAELVQKMSWFVRGNHNEFVELATKAGFLVHKVTDYKSNVKYHGEYWIYPANRGEQLAEIPFGFKTEN